MLYMEPKMELFETLVEDMIRTSQGTVVDKGNQNPELPENENDLGGW